jgi:WD40 repeat protein
MADPLTLERLVDTPAMVAPCKALRLANGNIASSHMDKCVRIWNPETGEAVWTLPYEGDVLVSSLLELPDGRLVTGTTDGDMWLWTLATEEYEALEGGPPSPLEHMLLLPDHRVFSLYKSGIGLLWDLETSTHTLLFDAGSVTTPPLFVGGEWIVVGCLQGRVYKTSVLHEGMSLFLDTDEEGEPVSAVCALEDGSLLAGTNAGVLYRWDEEGVRTRMEGFHDEEIRFVTPLSDGTVVTASNDKTLCVVNLETQECVRTLTGHTDWISAVAVLPNGRLLSAGWDYTMRLWDTATGACLSAVSHAEEGDLPPGSYDVFLETAYASMVCSMCLVPGYRVATLVRKGGLRVWDVSPDGMLG